MTLFHTDWHDTKCLELLQSWAWVHNCRSICILFLEQAVKPHLLTTQQQQHTKEILWHLVNCGCINAKRWEWDKSNCSHTFCNSVYLWVNGTEIMALIRTHTPHISILAFLRIFPRYKYIYSHADLASSSHLSSWVNECKALIQKRSML